MTSVDQRLQCLAAALSSAGLVAELRDSPARLLVRHPRLRVVGLTVMPGTPPGAAPGPLRLSTGPTVPADVPTAVRVVIAELGRYVKLPAHELPTSEPATPPQPKPEVEPGPVTLQELRVRFPHIHAWHGQQTGTWWALTRDQHGEDRLIEAPDPAQLGRRLERIGAPQTGAAARPTTLRPVPQPPAWPPRHTTPTPHRGRTTP